MSLELIVLILMSLRVVLSGMSGRLWKAMGRAMEVVENMGRVCTVGGECYAITTGSEFSAGAVTKR